MGAVSHKLAIVVLGMALSMPAWGQQWQVDYDTSRIGFVATYDDIAFEADFREYEVAVTFDPALFEQASFKASISIASVDSRSSDRDEGMLEPDWFDVGQYPYSTFNSSAFRQLQHGDGFIVTGELTLKGVTRPVEFAFSWESTGASARLKGQTRVNRTDFSIGTGDWAEDNTIGFDVEIVFDLKLTRS